MDDDTRQEFEQLKLDSTVTGPGKRTEDPYEPGTQLKIEGQRGIFVYKYATVSRSGAISLHVMREGISRAVRPDQAAPVKKKATRNTSAAW